MKSFDRLNKNNCNDFTFESWFHKGRFLLPFSLTGEFKDETVETDGTNEKILKPLASGQNLQLYTRFEKPTEQVLRLSVMITQLRSIAIESDRSTSRYYEVDQ